MDVGLVGLALRKTGTVAGDCMVKALSRVKGFVKHAIKFWRQLQLRL